MKNIIVKIIKYIRNYFVLGAFVVLPVLCLVTWNFPEELEFFIDTPSSVSIRIAQGYDSAKGDVAGLKFSRLLGLATHMHDNVAARMFFARPFDVDRCAYQIVGDNATFEFKKLSITRRLLLRWDLPAKNFLSSFDMSDNVDVSVDDDGRCIVKVRGASGCFWPKRSGLEWSFPSVSLSKWYGARRYVLYAAQLLLLLFALLPMFIRHEPWPLKSRLVPSAVIAFAFAIFVSAVLPLQTFLSNRDAFGIATVDVLKASLQYTTVMGLVMFGCLYATSFCYGRFFHVALSLFLLYEYLQTGILSIGFPTLNGDQQFFLNGSLAMRDMAVFAVIMGVGFGCYRFIKRYVHWIALAVAVLGLASLLDVRSSEGAEESKNEHSWNNSESEVVESVRYSSDKNVIVLVPDTLQGDVAQDVIEQCPEIRRLFAGFIGFGNNLGMHEYTTLGLPSLMTGRYYEGDMSPNEFLFTMTGRESFVSAYIDANWPTYILPQVQDCAFTNRSRVSRSNQEEEKVECRSAFEKRQSGVPYVNLLDVLSFRLTPFGLKRLSMNLSFAGIDRGGDLCFEGTLLPFLEVAPLSEEKGVAFHMFLSNGLHTPLSYNRHGERMNVPQNYSSMFEQCYFVLDRIGRYMEKLRERGLFDKAFVVIAADHGSGVSKAKLENGDWLPGRLLPILWVKPVGNEAPFVFDYTPTSHAKIKELVVRSKDEDLSIDQIREILKTNKRFYRQHFTGMFKDWHVDAAGKAECRDVECPYKGKGTSEDFFNREWDCKPGAL